MKVMFDNFLFELGLACLLGKEGEGSKHVHVHVHGYPKVKMTVFKKFC